MSDKDDKTSKDKAEDEFKQPPPAKKKLGPREPSTKTPLVTRARSATPSGTAPGASKPGGSRTSSTSSTGSRGRATGPKASSTTGAPQPSGSGGARTKGSSKPPSPERETPPPASSTFLEEGASAAEVTFGNQSTIYPLETTVIAAQQESPNNPDPDNTPEPTEEVPNDEVLDNSDPDSNEEESEHNQSEGDDEEVPENMATQKEVTLKGEATPTKVTIMAGKEGLWDQLMLQRQGGEFITSQCASQIATIHKTIPNVTNADAHVTATLLSSFHNQYRNVQVVDSAIKEILADEQSYDTFHKFSRDKLFDMENTMDKGKRILKSSSITETGDPDLDATFQAISPNVTVNATGRIELATTSKSSSRTRRDSDEGKSYDQPKKYELERLKWDGSKQTYSNFKKMATQVFGPKHYTYLTRFTCLREVLPDKQAKVLDSYPYDINGYNDFWSYLDRMFGQKTENVTYWLNKFNYLKPVEENNGRISLAQLETFYTSLKLIIAKLAENGKYGKDNHEEWKTTITAKLPQSIAMRWTREYQQIVAAGDPRVDPIQRQLQFLEEEVNTLRIIVTDFNMRKSYNTDQKKAKDKEKAKQEQSYATIEGGNKGKKKKGSAKSNEEYKSTAPPQCMLCDESNKKHHPKDCKKPAKDAWSRLYAHKACGGCGNLGHGIYNCQSKSKCTKEGCTWQHLCNLHDIPFLKKKEWALKQKK